MDVLHPRTAGAVSSARSRHHGGARRAPATFAFLFALAFAFAAAPLLGGTPTETKLLAGGGDAGDLLGGGLAAVNNGGPGVAIDDDVLVAGALDDDVGGAVDQGSATVYRRSGGAWIEEQTLTASGGAAGDRFGGAVAVSGEWIVVGAPEDDVGGAANAGSATVFRWDGATWVEDQTLVAGDAQGGDQFGVSVGVSGDVIVVGARADDLSTIDEGSARVFRRDDLAMAWVEEQTLSAATGASFDSFGSAVAIDGDVIAVGARSDDVGGNPNQGSVTIFRYDPLGFVWVEEDRLAAAAGAPADRLGSAVAIDGDVVLAGAPQDDVGGASNAGSATVFRWDGANWNEEQTLAATDAANSDLAGTSVALDGDRLAIGLRSDDAPGLPNQGSVLVYEHDGASWMLQTQLFPSDGAIDDTFGTSVAVQGVLVVAGAPMHDAAGPADRGAVYVYDLTPNAWSDEGCALAGVAGEPSLVGCGTLLPGSANELALADAAPNAVSGLFLGLTNGSIPFKGGTLKPFPILLDPIPLPTGPAGALALPFTWPSGVPSGTEVWVQFGIPDAAAVKGLALSNAVRGVVP